MARSLRMASALLAATLIPQTVTPQTVTYDYDRKANFSRLRSFALRSENMSDNPLMNERITVAIAGALLGRGMIRSDNPDMYVVPSLTTETRKELTSYDWGSPFGWYGSYGWYGHYGWRDPYLWNGGGWTNSYQVRDVEYATLTIDMLDGGEGTLLWRGKGVRDVNPGWKPDDIDKKVDKLVAKILKHFPPPVGD
jgi:uncharacterized protein DUF4136